MPTDSSRKMLQKLVRDNIPQLIEKSGRTPQYRVLPKLLRRGALIDKLHEEVHELVQTETPEEFLEEAADLYEVLLALVYENGFIDADLMFKTKQKRREKGGFDRFVWLEKIVD